MSEERKYCPICFASLRDDASKCLEENCAWWDKKAKQCACLSLIDVLSRIDESLNAVPPEKIWGTPQ